MRQLIMTAFLVLIWQISRLPGAIGMASNVSPEGQTLAALGLLVIGGHLVGTWITERGFPKVTGYMTVGIIVGPYLLNILGFEIIERVSLVNEIALVLIALTAGGELKVRKLRSYIKTVGSILLFQMLIIIAISIISLLFIKGRLFGGSSFGFAQIMIIGLLLGIMSAANSPSVAVAVVTEMKSQGRITDLVMSVTIAKDILILILFSVAIALSQGVSTGGDTIASVENPSIAYMLIGSIGLGLLSGISLLLYLKYIGRKIEIVLLIMTIAIIKAVRFWDVDLLLTALTIGVVVENLSQQGDNFIKGLEKVSPVIYVVFFALVGAIVNLKVLTEIWILALIWALVRAFGIWFGTWLGLSAAGDNTRDRKLLWLGYIPQAGVALGMTTLLVRTCPGWGEQAQILILAVIAVNQIAGPIGLRYALVKSGDAGKGD